MTTDPLAQLQEWYAAARAAGVAEPEAAALATATPDGRPSVRIVLLRGVGPEGIAFYTNYESRKGRELAANPRAALAIHWPAQHRQVRLEGPVERVASDQSDAYFESRPRGSRIGAWASLQSQPLESRFALEKAVARYTAKYGIGEIPRPAHWTGFRIRPVQIEFWADRPFRLHDRLVFRRAAPEGVWSKARLFP